MAYASATDVTRGEFQSAVERIKQLEEGQRNGTQWANNEHALIRSEIVTRFETIIHLMQEMKDDRTNDAKATSRWIGGLIVTALSSGVLVEIINKIHP